MSTLFCFVYSMRALQVNTGEPIRTSENCKFYQCGHLWHLKLTEYLWKAWKYIPNQKADPNSVGIVYSDVLKIEVSFSHRNQKLWPYVLYTIEKAWSSASIWCMNITMTITHFFKHFDNLLPLVENYVFLLGSNSGDAQPSVQHTFTAETLQFDKIQF